MSEDLLTEKARWAYTFFIQGKPAPGGSKNAFIPRRKDGSMVMRPGTNSPVINLSDAGKGNKEWKKVVAWSARAAWKSGVIVRPCISEFVFLLARPGTHFGSGSRSTVLRDDAPEYHTSAPDALKLARSTEDALKGVVYADDAQNVRTLAEKRYCRPGERPGCIVTIRVL